MNENNEKKVNENSLENAQSNDSKQSSSALEIVNKETGALEVSDSPHNMPQAKRSSAISSKNRGGLRGQRAAELANINPEHGLKKYKPPKEKTRAIVISYALILLASIIRALNIHVFVLPNDFAPGGVTGMSTMLQYASGWNSGIFLILINLPLIIISAIFLGKRFAFRTLISAALTSGLLLVLPIIDINGKGFYNYEAKNSILAALAGGVFSGLALAMLLKSGSSTGGSDIIATILHKKRPDINVGVFVIAIDAIVILVSIFVYTDGMDSAMLACVMLVVSSRLCNSILSGFKSAHKFEIITNEPDKVSSIIMQKLHHSVTMIPAIGMYQHEQRSLLVCVIRKSEVAEMQKIIKALEGTFCYVSETTEVYGNFVRGR